MKAAIKNNWRKPFYLAALLIMCRYAYLELNNNFTATRWLICAGSEQSIEERVMR